MIITLIVGSNNRNRWQLHWFKIGAIALLLLASILRGLMILRLPAGIARDEALNADIAELILRGNHAIVFSEGFGHEPLFHYLGAIFQYLVGDNSLAIRAPAFFCGVLIVALLLNSAEFSKPTAFIAALATTFSWWAITFSRVGLRPISLPLILLVALTLWRKRSGAAGVALGLSAYTYTAARLAPLWAIADIVFTLLLVRDSAEKRRRIKQSATVFATSLLIATPLYYTLQTSPELNERINQLAGPLDALRAGDPTWLLHNLIKSIGSFGLVNLDSSAYALDTEPLIPLIVGLLLIVGIVSALRRISTQHGAALILSGWLLFILPGAAAAESPTDIRMIGSLPMTMLLIGLGTTQLATMAVDKRRQRFFLVLLAGALSFSLLNQTINDGFNTWAALPETRQKYQSIWLDISDDIRTHGNINVVVADSWYEPVKADSLRRNYGHPLNARWIFNGDSLVLPQADSLLYVPEFAPLDPFLHTRVLNDMQPDLRSGNSPAYARYQLQSVKTGPALATFDNTVLLLSAEILPDNRILTQWEIKQTPTWDSTIFIHALDDADNLIAQSDNLSAAPDTLHPGDVLWQIHALDSAEISPATIRIGIYKRSSGQRLLLPDGADHYAMPWQEGADASR